MMKLSRSLLFMFSVGLAVRSLGQSPPAVQSNLVLLSRSDVKCIDGSPAAYYYDKTSSDKWVVWLEGGGVCSTEQSCIARSKTDLGSSKKLSQTTTFGESTGLLSADPSINPDFYEWNHIVSTIISRTFFLC